MRTLNVYVYFLSQNRTEDSRWDDRNECYQEVKWLQMFCRDDWRDSCKDTH